MYRKNGYGLVTVITIITNIIKNTGSDNLSHTCRPSFGNRPFLMRAIIYQTGSTAKSHTENKKMPRY